ncbi:MAG: hypothetical protein OXG23_16670 [Chloroflexi bacterium]|nr:hypothetical protein [Chloroflexota bacterium]
MSQPFDILTAPQFDRDVKRLRKKYRRIGEDLRALLQEFEALDVHGELMIGYGRELRKVRLTNRSANRGKSGGFRALYVTENDSTIRLIRLYSKTEESTLSRAEISRTLRFLP